MTNKEAIEFVRVAFSIWESEYGTGDDWREEHEACDIAIKALEQQSRTGHWSRKVKVDAYDIEGVKTWGIKCQCDRCDFTSIVVEDFGYYKYCPNCGTKMEVEK